MNRRSIEIASLTHENPIPAACRIGPLIVSGNIIGFDPGTRRLPPSFEAQVANLFIHMGEVLAEAGAGWDDVAKINVVANDSAVKAALNRSGSRLSQIPHLGQRDTLGSLSRKAPLG